MARLEEDESGDAAAARDWLDRAIGAPSDPSYVCSQCGGDSPHWQALCPDCGGFDTLAWGRPPSAPAVTVAQSADASGPLMLPAPRVPSGEAGPLPSGLASPPRWDK